MSDRPSATFWLPFIPSGAKNSRDIVTPRGGGRPFPKTNDRVIAQWKRMTKIIENMRHRGLWPDFGDDELELLADIDCPRGATLVRVRSLWPKPKGSTGRGRDVDNVLSTIFDGLGNKRHQAHAIDDDRQIRRTACERWPEGIGGIDLRDVDQVV